MDQPRLRTATLPMVATLLAVSLPGGGACLGAEPTARAGAAISRWADGLAGPQGLALDAQGHVLVVEHDAGRIRRFQRDGRHPTTVAEGLRGPAWALWLDGTLYVSERKGNSVARIDPSGAVTRLPGEVIDPLGLIADPTSPGSLLVLSHRESVVRRFAPDSSRQLRLQAEAVAVPAEGKKYGWRDLLITPDGTLYVTDELSRSILRRQSGGAWEVWAKGLSSPSGLALSPRGTIFVTEEGNGRVGEVGPDGQVRVFAEGLGMAREVLFLDERTLLVSDRQGGIVWKLVLPG